VSDTVENAAVYLTTSMNYVTVPKSKTKVVDVALINYVELNSENIKWLSNDYNTVTVVGTGRTVQIYGVELGFAKLTVTHPASYNDLEIMVKVVEEHDMSNVAYLTTNDNIIETYVQDSSLQVMVEKIGGKIPSIETSWLVDNPSVASVSGSGNIGYIVPRKAGITKVTVTEREAENLDIIVIVKEVKAGTEYITTEESVVQLSPGQFNHPLQVRLVGGNDTDLQDFEWQVYSQFPSDWEVAKNGGTVISLFGMGDRAAISANYVGTARVRVSHPKAQLPLYIVVQVTNFESMAFNEREALILNGDIYFAGIRIPNYENFTGKVEYSTDNPAACVVTGSDRVALLQSQGTGRAKITAIVRGTDLKASIDVQVIERDNFAEPNIIIPKTTYMLNPREKPFQIEAYLQGVGVTEESRYGIKWEAMLLSGGDIEEVMSIFPGGPEIFYPPVSIGKPAPIKVLRGTGPVIQIEVLNPPLPDGKKFETKEIVIMVSQSEITTRTKAVYIKIAEVSGIFTVSKLDISMEPQNMVDLSCTILGGKSSDYKEVVWFAETDSVGREIVKIMPDKGQNVKVMGIHDGTVYVTVMYRNEIAECRVQVKSNFYLKLQYEIFFTYPGAKKEGNLPVEVEFEVRPFTAQVMWVPQGPAPDADNPIAEVLVSTQDYVTGKGKVTINPTKEGSFELVGLTNRSTARMTVIIKNVYRLQVSNNRVFMQPGSTTTYNPPIKSGDPYWNYNSQYAPVIIKTGGEDKIGDSIYMPFVVCPPDHRISFSQASITKMANYGISHEISPILKISELEGRGIIKLTVSREIPSTEYGDGQGMILELDMKKPLEDTVIDPGLYSSNPLYPNNKIFLKCQLPLHQTLAIPVFQRVSGPYSNEANKQYKYKYYNGDSTTNYVNANNNATANTGFGPLSNVSSSSNNGFDINNPNWQSRPTGVLPEFDKASYAESTSYYMTISGNYNRSATGHSVTYNLDIGDGEEHYILLDRTHEGMFYEFDETAWNTSKSSFENAIKAQDFYKNKEENRAPKVDLVDLNGSKAIRITGGQDFTVFDRVLIKDRKKLTLEYFSPTSLSEGKVYDVSNPTDIINNTATPTQYDEYIDELYLKDYYLVKRFGITLNMYHNTIYNGEIYNVTEDADGNSTYTLNDMAAIDDHTVCQIVYWKQGQRPIRVRYVYSRLEEYNNLVNIISNDGGPVDFYNATSYFGNNKRLYVTKPDGKGDYFIKNINNDDGHSYSLNSTISKINTNAYFGCDYRTHQTMVSYNPHFEELFGETLYIVSDFDLGSSRNMWYTGGSDYSTVFAPGGFLNNDGITRSYLGEMYLGRGRYRSSQGRQRLTIFCYLGGSRINKTAFVWFNDEDDHNNQGWFYNLANGRQYFLNMYVNRTYNFVNSELFKDVGLDGYPVHIQQTTNPGYYYASIGTSNVIANAKQVNWKAILSVLKHNNDNGTYTAIIEKLDDAGNAVEFEKRYDGTLTGTDSSKNLTPAQRNSIFNLVRQGNEKGSLHINIHDGIEFYTQNNYPNFKTNTLYVKRETEKGYNGIHSVNDFQGDHAAGGFTASSDSGAYHFITEDLSDSNFYEPVSTKRNDLVFTSQPVILSLKYKNSYTTERTNRNEINIRVTHKIRSGVFSDSGNGTSYVKDVWANMRKVTNLPAPFTGSSSSFNKYYGYFFIPKDDQY
jgi:hypothetical protein